MKYKDVIKKLHKMGDEQTRKVWKRHGAPPGRHLGVSIGKLRKFAKELGGNQDLAESLWTSKYIDAQMLATMVAEPEKMDKKDLNRWAYEVDYWVVAEEFAQNVVIKTKIKGGRLRRWLRSKDPSVKLVALNILKKWPAREKYIEDDEMEKIVEHILDDFWDEPDRVKQAMLYALVTVGKRNPQLNKLIVREGKKMSKVKLDLGEGTQCKVPDLVQELTDGKIKARWQTLVP